jgi:hypothetical protein
MVIGEVGTYTDVLPLCAYLDEPRKYTVFATVYTKVQSVIGCPVPPFISKPAFKSTFGPGARGVGVGVTVGVVNVEEMMLVDETLGVDDAMLGIEETMLLDETPGADVTKDEDETIADEGKLVLLIETSGVAEELVREVLEAMMLEDEGGGESATRVSKKAAVRY